MQNCTRKMEKVEILGKISKISKDLNIIDKWKIGEDIKKVLVEEERGKKRCLDRKYYKCLVEKKKRFGEGVTIHQNIDQNALAWREFLVSWNQLVWC